MTGSGADAAYSAPDSPNLEFFHRLDERVRYVNQKGMMADLVLAGGEGTLTKLFPQRRSAPPLRALRGGALCRHERDVAGRG